MLRISAQGQRRFERAPVTSALAPTADIWLQHSMCRFGPTTEVDRSTQMPNLGERNSSGRLSRLEFALTGRLLTELPACQIAEIIRDGRRLDFRSLH